MIKVVNFSTFINVLRNSKVNVTHAICKLYSMYDNNNFPNVKLLIGSLHWLRRVRNSCAHNECVYCIHQTQVRNNSASGRILDPHYTNAFDNVRGQMGIKNLNILDTLIILPKSKIEYHKFDTL